MIITTSKGKSFDTDRDLSAPERHIIQKLFAWESISDSIEHFMGKKEEAFLKGWNNSGPIQESAALREIIRDLERKVAERLSKKPL
jgi:hypothetical protein